MPSQQTVRLTVVHKSTLHARLKKEEGGKKEEAGRKKKDQGQLLKIAALADIFLYLTAVLPVIISSILA